MNSTWEQSAASGTTVVAGVIPAHAETAGVPRATFQAHDFRGAGVLSPGQTRALKTHQDDFAAALASRLSLFLRLDVSVKLTGLQTVLYQKMTQTWAEPSHLTLFKIEPLRGVCILEIPPRLGSAMVDRLMGGPGLPWEGDREFSEIEKALLEQAAQLVVSEWCGRWRGVKELKPAVLGQESNGRYVQTASPDTIMLSITVEARVGRCVEKIQIGLPHAAVEALIRQLNHEPEKVQEVLPSNLPKTAPKWNKCFDDLCVPVRAEWEGLEMTARDILNLQVGDVLRMDPQCAGQVSVSVADEPRFDGRPGTIAGKWAVELTRVTTHPA